MAIPTHGLGPVAWYLGINHGDRFDYMVLMSTPEFGLTKWREDHIPKDDPHWKEQGERARTGGHGGMDFIMAWRLVTCLREGLAPDMNVYDAAAWSVPGPLSEKSVATGSAPVKFPDFTRGSWRKAASP